MVQSMNMELNEEVLPKIDESELEFGRTFAPVPEGTYAVRATLGKNGMKSVVVGKNSKGEDNKTYTIHAVNEILKPLEYISPNAPGVEDDLDKLFKRKDGKNLEIHDFFRLSATNRMGIIKAIKFLKAAGDEKYNSYPTHDALAEAVVEALKAGPDGFKLNGRWEANVEKGVNPQTQKKEYDTKRGMKVFPLKEDGSRNHTILIKGVFNDQPYEEFANAQFVVQDYGALTAKDVA